MMHKKSRDTIEISLHKYTQTVSLRWHYPNQVTGQNSINPISACCCKLPTFYFTKFNLADIIISVKDNDIYLAADFLYLVIFCQFVGKPICA
jgi:hypothetical protein